MQHDDATATPVTVDHTTRIDYVAAAAHPVTVATYELVTRHGPAAIIDGYPAGAARAARDRAERLLTEAHHHRVRAIVPGDAEWPRQIAGLNRDGEAPGAPLCLWARGPARLDHILASAVLVTGSRDSTAYGKHIAQQIGYQLADGRRGWSIANGGHFGIETEALKGAMVADCHRPPLVMLACGLDRGFPLQRADLLNAVASAGLLLSAFPPGAHPSATAARHRMDMLAALTSATVIVEAMNRGSRSFLALARSAAAMQRPVLAVPGPVTSMHSAGCHQLIRDGVARLVTDAGDILDEIQTTPAV